MVDDLFHVCDDDVVVLHVHARPGAARSRVVGRHGGALKVAVAAPPEGGRANRALVDVLAAAFGVRPGAVHVVGGATAREKRVAVAGLDPAAARAVLERLVAGEVPGTGRERIGPRRR